MLAEEMEEQNKKKKNGALRNVQRRALAKSNIKSQAQQLIRLIS